MPAPESTYPDDMVAQHGRSLARLERAAICDTFEAVGPDAPTLSGDWDARHLAAHLVLREGRVGAAASPIPKVGDRGVDTLARRRDFGDLVDAVRQGPPRVSFFALPGIDKRLNLLEYYVHHEDLRRANPAWTARAFPAWAEDKLGRGVKVIAKVTMRRSPVPVRLVRSDTGASLDTVPGADGVIVSGLPSELVLYAYGRSEVAQVDIDGPDDAVRRFGAARFAV